MVRVEHICPSVSLSANESFKLNYGRTLRWSMLAAVIALGLLWMFLPRYEPTPYTLRQDYMEWIEIEEPELDIPEETPLLPVPVVPRDIEPVPGNFEEEPWIPPDFWDPMPVVQAPVDPSIYDGFVASSSKPRLTFQAKPDYPQVARMSGLEGTVIVDVLVGSRGKVEQARIAQGVHPLLDKAALAAAYRCRFEPGTQRKVPVRAWVSVPYRFRMH